MTYALGFLLYAALFLVPALALWAFVFRFLPWCLKAYRAVKEDEWAQWDFEERVMLKAGALRERHDALLEALETLVRMHNGGPDAVGNWDWALNRAEKAIALAKTPLLADASAQPVKPTVQQ